MDSDTNKSGKPREHFICFTFRLSMKISFSKSSVVSPGRSRDPPNNKLPISLSRRLRASSSMKNGGQASPMFPTGGRKKGTGFENPEPSSPKVTCIGQVRVKTKKQGKKMRTLSSSRSRRFTKESSFRRMDSDENHNNNNNVHMIQRQGSLKNHSFHHQQQECSSSSSHRNQRWVHLPLTICETLRSFGADVSCLFPCNKSSCFSGDGGGGKWKREGGWSCVGAFARWLVAVEVGGDKVVVEEEKVRSIRRHVFDEIEIREEGVSEGRVSVCVPPKNALLLMRCRSDPVKMEALANRFWEPQLDKEDEEDDDYEDEVEEIVVVETLRDKSESLNDVLVLEKHRISIDERRRISVSFADNAEEEDYEEEDYEEEEKCTEVDNEPPIEGQGKALMHELEINDQENEEKTREKGLVLVEEENELSFVTALEALVDQETESEDEVDKNEEGSRVSYSFNSFTPHSSESDKICKPEDREEGDLVQEVGANEASNVEEEEEGKDQISQVEMMEKVTAEKEEESAVKIVEEKERKSVEIMDKQNGLPDCLLLMMCEPKLSMEVSKETWVCSRDFIRYQPHKKKKPLVKAKEADEKRRLSIDSAAKNPFAALPPQHPAAQQPRSSCSSATAMATMIEQKLVDAVAYEPFVLTRCKSEPMRTAALKNGRIEPHRRSTVGVGAAGF